MKSITSGVPRRLGALGVLAALSLLASGAQAQRVGGSGFGSSVRALGITTSSPVATLSDAGGYAIGDAQTFGVSNILQARWLTAVTTGSVSDATEPASAQTTSEVESVNILNGLVRVDNVTAIASSFANAAGAGSNADGSGFVNLVVNGTPISANVAPNTRINIPFVGYVALNEQTRTGDGVTSSGIQVRMIRVQLLSGTEVVVGSASSSASR